MLRAVAVALPKASGTAKLLARPRLLICRRCATPTGATPSPDSKQDLFSKLDTNKDGVLSKEEFSVVEEKIELLKAEIARLEEKKAPVASGPPPWHVFSPVQLAVVSTCANLCALTAAFVHDHTYVRAFAGTAATFTAAFNFLMPKPLKDHQWTAGLWATAFAFFHLYNLKGLLEETTHSRTMSDEEAEIYHDGFQRHGVTPRQYGTLVHLKGKKFRDYAPGQIMVEEGKEVDKIIYIVQASEKCPIHRHDASAGPDSSNKADLIVGELPQHTFVGNLMPEHWQARKLDPAGAAAADTKEIGAYLDSNLKEQVAKKAQMAEKASIFTRPKNAHSKTLKEVLTEGIEESGIVVTPLLEGETWKFTVRAGEAGCRTMEWPLEAFADAVAEDEKLVLAMDDFVVTSLAHKLSSGSDRLGEEAYQDMLSVAILDGRIEPEEKVALRRHRVRHKISDEEHAVILNKLGWTVQQYEDGVKTSFLRKRMLSWSKSVDAEEKAKSA